METKCIGFRDSSSSSSSAATKPKRKARAKSKAAEEEDDDKTEEETENALVVVPEVKAKAKGKSRAKKRAAPTEAAVVSTAEGDDEKKGKRRRVELPSSRPLFTQTVTINGKKKTELMADPAPGKMVASARATEHAGTVIDADRLHRLMKKAYRVDRTATEGPPDTARIHVKYLEYVEFSRI